MEWYIVLALIGVGLVSGFMNIVAGGGSLLTLPMLMFLGLPANVANGTNRIAILFNSIVGVNVFRRNKVLDIKTDYRLTIPAIVGSILGAVFAVEINEDILQKIIAVLMVFMLLLVILKPEAWVKGKVGQVVAKPSVLQYFIFFLIGFYGGFIQIGVGFILIVGLVFGCGYDLVKTNAVKVFIILFYTAFALVIFIWNKQVDFASGLILASGNMMGAWLGAKFTIKGGSEYVRYVLIIALVVMTAKLFELF
ncbi:MAG: hypothetical protein A2W90_17160 [Bacteroidetes bacterium GWF2_42_66]|nr:MAG: hypothetical protein A2W89_04485 [Bacteroidetes bacterium GWE2_42_39]OFY43256.1 MAG: hypothetical protein A2W90_17160 [Bacteroidetes bacterium GWF2_42_66]HAZ04558.1 hypothetical protein [Marinilabiliales bacterium]HBL77287.1 hypothetical protein [Prolixibacteraceae bacterium]HCU61780.1 hypothetical protein [Prolixibacteraceae bacterium]